MDLGVDAARLAPLLGSIGPFAVVDLETTGLSNDSAAEILEFGIITVDPDPERPGMPIFHTLSGLVKPAREIPLGIQRLTGLRPADRRP